MRRIINHVSAHPLRMLATTCAIVVASWLAAGFAILVALDANHANDVAVCRQVNEALRHVAVAAADEGWSSHSIAHLLPSRDCEAIP